MAEIAGRALKKTALELGGKSANIIPDEADLEKVIPAARGQSFVNSGTVSAALSPLHVPQARPPRGRRLSGKRSSQGIVAGGQDCDRLGLPPGKVNPGTGLKVKLGRHVAAGVHPLFA